MPTAEQVNEVLKTCQDPELGLDVVKLGLIYDISIKDDKVKVLMTFTTPFCPYGETLVEEIKDKIKHLPEVKHVDVEVTFEPAWQPPEEIKLMFGL